MWFLSLYCPKISVSVAAKNRAETLQKWESWFLWQFLEVLPLALMSVVIMWCFYMVYKMSGLKQNSAVCQIKQILYQSVALIGMTVTFCTTLKEWKYLTDKILTFDWDSLFRLMALSRNAAITAQNSKCIDTITVFTKYLKPLRQEVLLIEEKVVLSYSVKEGSPNLVMAIQKRKKTNHTTDLKLHVSSDPILKFRALYKHSFKKLRFFFLFLRLSRKFCFSQQRQLVIPTCMRSPGQFSHPCFTSSAQDTGYKITVYFALPTQPVWWNFDGGDTCSLK